MSSVWLDLVVIALLLAACVYGARLHARLGVMRRSQEEMIAAIAAFDAAARRAESAVDAMNRETSNRRGRAEDATGLINDLGIMIAAGERAAQRLEAAIALTRNQSSRAA
jgi:hypothetical protein